MFVINKTNLYAFTGMANVTRSYLQWLRIQSVTFCFCLPLFTNYHEHADGEVDVVHLGDFASEPVGAGLGGTSRIILFLTVGLLTGWEHNFPLLISTIYVLISSITLQSKVLVKNLSRSWHGFSFRLFHEEWEIPSLVHNPHFHCGHWLSRVRSREGQIVAVPTTLVILYI